MKILIVSSCPSSPITSGNRKFISEQIRLFKELGHSVYFLYVKEYVLGSDFSKEISCMQQEWKDHLYVYDINIFQKIWRTLLVRYRWLCNKGYYKCDDFYPWMLHKKVKAIDKRLHLDACIINYYNLSKLFSKIDISRKAIVTHDYFAYKDLLIGKSRIYLNTTASEEAKALQRCPTIWALNEEESHYFYRLAPNSEVRNVYSLYRFIDQPIVGNHNILFFSGSNEYNVNGLKWFIKKVFPEITYKYNDAKLIVGGSICKILEEEFCQENIILYGRVDDIDTFFAQGDIAINPTYQGTGLKIKTFEAISYGKATIVHPHSSIGIYDKEHAPIFVATQITDWTKYIDFLWKDISILKDNKKDCLRYIESMRNYVTQQYIEFLK